MHKSAQKILLDSTHFHEIRSTIASKPVAWDALVRAAEVNELDAEIAKTLESTLVKFSNTNGRLGFSVEQCLSSLVHLLSSSGSQDARRTVVNLITVLLTHDTYVNQALAFFRSSPNMVKSLYEATLSTENTDDQFVLISTFNVVSLLIQEDLQSDELVEQLLVNPNYLRVLRNMEQMDTCYVCIRLLQALVGVKRYRLLVWAHEGEFMPLLFQSVGQALEAKSPMRVAANNSNNLGIQSQYYALMIIWLLTFEPSIASELAVRYLPDVLKLLKVVKITIKEKITRLSIAIILNCLAPNVRGRKATIKNLLLLGSALSIIQQLSERKYSDEELRTDLSKLQELLESEYQELTSFDEYVAELDSKLLVWSPPHVDSSFWSENSNRFKENNWKLFKQLLQVLREFSASQDSRHNIAVQVALNDITHIVELQPECVDVLGKLNAKVIIMELLNHPDSKIKYEALKTTQAFVANTFK